MKKLAIVFLVSTILSIGSAWGYALWASQPNTAVQTEQVVTTEEAASNSDPVTVESLLKAVNFEREKVNVAPLKIDDRLNRSAQAKADDMRNRNYREHVDPDGKHGYDIAREYAGKNCASGAGENLSNSQNKTTAYASTWVIIDSWVSSPAHYRAMTNSTYIYTGFGINGDIVVEHFCKP